VQANQAGRNLSHAGQSYLTGSNRVPLQARLAFSGAQLLSLAGSHAQFTHPSGRGRAWALTLERATPTFQAEFTRWRQPR
jgi:hypothetical protein